MSITIDWALAVITYAFVSSITPGPNNTMLLASGVNFGVARTVPHLLGVSLGFGAMALLIGSGLHAVFERYPLILEMLRYVGSAYMVYLAYKIWQSSAPSQETSSARPMSFLAACAFQWVNVKAVIMAITAITLFAGRQSTVSEASWAPLLIMTGLFVTVNLACCGSWVVFGAGMRRWLQNPQTLKIFNTIMALGLLLSLIPIFKS